MQTSDDDDDDDDDDDLFVKVYVFDVFDIFDIFDCDGNIFKKRDVICVS
jgi:hypothetical protein